MTCGKRHRKWSFRNPANGRFSQDRRLYGYFIVSVGIGCALVLSFIGVNTIVQKVEAKLATFVSVVEVNNAQAESPLTWQEEVMQTLKDYGVDTIRANKIITCESNWNPNAIHQNKGSVDRGLWQINSVSHPEVTKTCAIDTNCSTINAIRIIKTSGWDQWVCNKLI